MPKIAELHRLIEDQGIPIHGVTSDGDIHFKDVATKEQKKQAEEIVNSFDFERQEKTLAEFKSDVSRMAIEEREDLINRCLADFLFRNC